MPHDLNGVLLNKGDFVSLKCEIMNITEGQTAEDYCNLLQMPVYEPLGTDGCVSLACNSHRVTLIPGGTS